MSSFGISSVNFYGSLRTPVLKVQADIDRIQQEVSSGRRSDLGRQLGSGVAISIGLRNDLDNIQTHLDVNGVVSGRLDATQSALGSIKASAGHLQEQLLANLSGTASAGTLLDSGRAALNALVSTLNTSYAGQQIFGGQNSHAPTIKDYFSTTPSAAKTSIDQAFSSTFGFSQGAAGASTISGAQMNAFLDTQFSALFSPANWAANWSQASDNNQQDRISPTQTVESSVNANEAGFRTLAQAFSMISDLGIDQLGADARNAVVTKASTLIGNAINALANSESKIGNVQNAISASNEAMSAQATYLKTQIGALENIDPAQASTELTSLTTQLQSAYSLTARISQLSLLKFL